MESSSRNTKVVQLMGPNRLSLAQKQRIGADPVSNLLKYQKGWSMQGDPSERQKRLWTNKVNAMKLEQQNRDE